MAGSLRSLVDGTPRFTMSAEMPSEAAADFDPTSDSYMLTIGAPRAALSWDMGDDVWVRYLPMTGEVVGIEVENFTHRFLPNHPELAAMWSAIQQEEAAGVAREVGTKRPSLVDQFLKALRRELLDVHHREGLFA